MPTPATASLQMQFDTGSGYGSPVQGGQVVPAGTVVKLSASSYAGWGAPAGDYEIPAGSYPEGWACPSGWTAYPDGSYHYLASAITGYAPPPFTLPDTAGVAAGLFGKWGLQLTVNGGGSPGLVDASCAIEIVGQTGIHDLGNREGAQFGGPARRWAGPVQRNWRLMDAALAGGVGGGVSLGAGTPAKVKAAAGTQGALAVAAAFDHRHEVEVAAPVAIGTTIAAGSQTTLAPSDHVHTLPFSVLLAVLAAATGNIGFNGMKLVNVGAPTASGDVVTYDYANALVNFTNVAAALGAATGNVGINGWQITGSGAPTSSSSLTTKAYVDAVAQGLDWKQEVRGASLGNQSLTGPLTEDGITYVTGDRYLAKNQAIQTNNGLWIVNTAGAWTRAPDAAVSSDVTPGMFCFVLSGTANGKTGWALFTPGPIVLGTTALAFTQIFGPGSFVAGAGLTQSGNVLNVAANADGSIVVNADIQVGVLATDAQHGARGGAGLHAWLADAAAVAAGTASGLVRAASNVAVAVARIAAGGQDHVLLATDNADTVLLGDLVRSAAISVRMKAAGLFQLLANTTKVVSASSAGVALGGDVDAGGGTGVLNLHDATVAPTGFPTNGALLSSGHGAVTIAGPTGIRTGLNAQGEGTTPPTQLDFIPRVGLVATTDATPTVLLALTIPQTQMAMEVALHVMGYHVDSAFDSRMIVRCRRISAGVVNITSLSYTGIPDLDDFGGCAVTGAANGNNLEIKVKGYAGPISWMAEAKVTLFKP